VQPAVDQDKIRDIVPEWVNRWQKKLFDFRLNFGVMLDASLFFLYTY